MRHDARWAGTVMRAGELHQRLGRRQREDRPGSSSVSPTKTASPHLRQQVGGWQRRVGSITRLSLVVHHAVAGGVDLGATGVDTAHDVGGRRIASACANRSRLHTPIIGMPNDCANPLAVAMPTRRPVNSPGPDVDGDGVDVGSCAMPACSQTKSIAGSKDLRVPRAAGDLRGGDNTVGRPDRDAGASRRRLDTEHDHVCPPSRPSLRRRRTRATCLVDVGDRDRQPLGAKQCRRGRPTRPARSRRPPAPRRGRGRAPRVRSRGGTGRRARSACAPRSCARARTSATSTGSVETHRRGEAAHEPRLARASPPTSTMRSPGRATSATIAANCRSLRGLCVTRVITATTPHRRARAWRG